MKLKLFLISLLFTASSMAADYKVDIKGMHAAIQFKISHLGTSWLLGRFDDFSGEFNFDADKPSESKVKITVETKSVNSNHAERDKHLRGKDFLNVDEFPQATFVSDSFTLNADNSGVVTGKFKLHGVEKTVTINIKKVGEGKDPWGGYRAGFEGNITLTLADFGINTAKKLGAASATLDLMIYLEGVRK